MSDLISKADAKQQISEWATIITNPTLLDKDATMLVLDTLPSADAVTVMRCKDCRYRNGKVNRKGFEVCDANGMDITDNDYCSWGERRKE